MKKAGRGLIQEKTLRTFSLCMEFTPKPDFFLSVPKFLSQSHQVVPQVLLPYSSLLSLRASHQRPLAWCPNPDLSSPCDDVGFRTPEKAKIPGVLARELDLFAAPSVDRGSIVGDGEGRRDSSLSRTVSKRPTILRLESSAPLGV